MRDDEHSQGRSVLAGEPAAPACAAELAARFGAIGDSLPQPPRFPGNFGPQTAAPEPGLAARFSIFNQLSRQEDMPGTERVTARAIRRQKWVERAIAAYLISGPDTLLRTA